MIEEWDKFRDRTVVYTCVIGDYDYIGGHEYADGIDYVFFTDGQSHPVDSRWEVIEMGLGKSLDSRRRAKIPKIAPHLLDPDFYEKYDYGIWIDGSMQIANANFPFELLSLMGDNSMVISPHFDGRHCAYGEATICETPKYINEPLPAQSAHYKKIGFPYNYGLFEAGVLGRDFLDEDVIQFNNDWFIENMIWSYQDQVSFPFCMWKNSFTPSILPKSWRDYGWLTLNAHKSES